MPKHPADDDPRMRGWRRISEDAVRAKTGKGWDEWFEILDAFGVAERGHTAAARHLREEHGVSGWWAQAVTGRYEHERDLRPETRAEYRTGVAPRKRPLGS